MTLAFLIIFLILLAIFIVFLFKLFIPIFCPQLYLPNASANVKDSNSNEEGNYIQYRDEDETLIKINSNKIDPKNFQVFFKKREENPLEQTKTHFISNNSSPKNSKDNDFEVEEIVIKSSTSNFNDKGFGNSDENFEQKPNLVETGTQTKKVCVIRSYAEVQAEIFAEYEKERQEKEKQKRVKNETILCNNEDEEKTEEEELMTQIHQIQKIQKVSGTNLLDEDIKVLICSSHSSTQISGYCIDFYKKECDFYTFPIDALPWKIESKDLNESSEIGTKNLLFALILWEGKLKSKIQVFKGTRPSLNKRENSNNNKVNEEKYESIVYNFIEHLKCKEIKLANSNINLNINSSNDDLNKFSQFIQPSLDLLNWNFSKAKSYIEAIYGISTFKTTHSNKSPQKGSLRGRPCMETNYYREFLEKAKEGMHIWKLFECKNCKFSMGELNKELK